MTNLTIIREIKTVCLTCGREVYAQLEGNILQIDRCRFCVDAQIGRILRRKEVSPGIEYIRDNKEAIKQFLLTLNDEENKE